MANLSSTSIPAGSIPAYIGSYQVIRMLGEGAFGVVYQSYQAFLDRQVAIKVLHTDLTADRAVEQQFMNEARTIARLRHPNIVSVYEFGLIQTETVPLTYMVMENLPGETLQTRLNRARLPILQVLRIIEQLAEGLDYAHAHHVIHRDLKPANILFSEQDPPVVVDFGLAKLVEVTPSAGISTAAPLSLISTPT